MIRGALGLALSMALSIALVGCSWPGKQHDPASGTHTKMTLRVESASGVEDVRRIVEARAKAAGFNAKAEADGQQVILTVAGDVDQSRLNPLAAPGALRFHKVIDMADGSGAPLPTATPVPLPGGLDPRDLLGGSALPLPSGITELPGGLDPRDLLGGSPQPLPTGITGLPDLRELLGLPPVDAPSLTPTVKDFRADRRTCAQLAAARVENVVCDRSNVIKYLLEEATDRKSVV